MVNPNDPDQFEVGDTVLNFDARNEIFTALLKYYSSDRFSCEIAGQ